MNTNKNLAHIETARDNCLKAAQLLQTLLDCQTTSQRQVAEQLSLSVHAMSRYLTNGFRPYICMQILSIPDLADAYRTTRTSADKLLIQIFNLADKDRDALAILPEYDEEALWDLVFATLSPREREIILYMFGQDDGTVRTVSDTAEKFHLSRQNVSYTYQKALRKLHRPPALKKIFPAITYVLPEYLRILTQQANEAIAMAEEAKKQYAIRNKMTDIAKAYDTNTPPADTTDQSTPINIKTQKHDVYDVPLSTRLRSALLRAGIHYLEDVPPDYPDYFRVRNLGRISRKELHDALKHYTGIDRPDLLK